MTSYVKRASTNCPAYYWSIQLAPHLQYNTVLPPHPEVSYNVRNLRYLSPTEINEATAFL